MVTRKSGEPKSTEARKLPPGADPLLTTEQVAEYIGGTTTRRTVEDWRHNGTGPDYIPVTSRMVRYRLSAVDAWLDAKARRSKSSQGVA